MAHVDDAKQMAKFHQHVVAVFAYDVSHSTTQKTPLGESNVDGFVRQYVILGRITNPKTGKTVLFASRGTTWAVASDAIKTRCRDVLMAFPALGDELQVMQTSCVACVARETTEAQLIEYMTQQESNAHSKRSRESTRPLTDDALINAVEKLN